MSKFRKILSLIICLMIICSLGIAALADDDNPDDTDPSPTPSESISPDPSSSASPTPTPTETATPTPSETITPTSPTPTPTATPTETPTPTATPTPEPTDSNFVISKNPVSEIVYEGDAIVFVARADGATDIHWYVESSDGKTKYDAGSLGNYFTGVTTSGTRTETLVINNASKKLSGWKAYATFTNINGNIIKSNKASITVLNGKNPADSSPTPTIKPTATVKPTILPSSIPSSTPNIVDVAMDSDNDSLNTIKHNHRVSNIGVVIFTTLIGIVFIVTGIVLILYVKGIINLDWFENFINQFDDYKDGLKQKLKTDINNKKNLKDLDLDNKEFYDSNDFDDKK